MPTKMLKQKKQGAKARRSKGLPSALQLVPTAFSKIYPAYVFGSTLTEPGIGLGNYYSYRMNSIYDPDFSGVGSSAVGYGNLSLMYGLFRVKRVRVMVRAFLTTTGTATVGILPGLNSTYAASIATWQIQPNVQSKMIQGNTGGARAIAEFDVTYDMAKIAGITQKQFDTDMDFTHAVTANPVRSLYLTVFAVGSSGAAQTCVYTIRFVYEVEVSQPSQALTS
jgi:hypothetical protein